MTVEVHRVLAPNPGPFTGPGTNSYVVISAGAAAVIDPGPTHRQHLGALGSVIAPYDAVAVLVTHTHPDHAPAANPLAATLGVPAIGFAPGPDFRPDRLLGDGDEVAVGDVKLQAVHTPGHTSDHLCYRLGDRLFTGDHIMGGSTVVIEDATDYAASLRKVAALDVEVLHPGHGPDLPDAREVITDYIRHREERERQLVGAVAGGARTVGELVADVYRDVPDELVPAAIHQVIVQLRKLATERRVQFDAGGTGPDAPVRPGEETRS